MCQIINSPIYGRVVYVYNEKVARKIFSNPSFMRLEDPKRLKGGYQLFLTTILSSNNEIHFPFQNHPCPKDIDRLLSLCQKISDSISDTQYQKLIDIIREGDNYKILSYYAKIGGANIFGDCPFNREIMNAGQEVPLFGEIFHNKDLRECQKNKAILETYYGKDVKKIHNAITSSLFMLPLLKDVVLTDRSIKDILSSNAPVEWALRLNSYPYWNGMTYIERDTIHLINLGMCAHQRETLEDTYKYVFGQGNNERRCPYGIVAEKVLEKLRSLR